MINLYVPSLSVLRSSKDHWSLLSQCLCTMFLISVSFLKRQISGARCEIVGSGGCPILSSRVISLTVEVETRPRENQKRTKNIKIIITTHLNQFDSVKHDTLVLEHKSINRSFHIRHVAL